MNHEIRSKYFKHQHACFKNVKSHTVFSQLCIGLPTAGVGHTSMESEQEVPENVQNRMPRN